MGERLTPKTCPDFIERLSKAPIFAAIEELIWNSFDEQAQTVAVDVAFNELGGATRITISDDGTSLARDRAREAFSNLGNSDKKSRHGSVAERPHGFKGEGRHKALSLGGSAVWTFVYKKDGALFQYEVEGTAGHSEPFYLTDERPAPKTATIGCTVVISQIKRSLHELKTSEAARELTVQFAPYLLRHRARRLLYQSVAINPRSAIQEKSPPRTFRLQHDGETYKVQLEVIHWNADHSIRDVLLCSADGVPYHTLQRRALPMAGSYSVFVRSELFEKLHRTNELALIEMASHPGDNNIVKPIRSRVRKYFTGRAQTKTEAALDHLKKEGSYPYAGRIQGGVEAVEQKVFDLCAVNIIRHLPNFNVGMDTEGRTLLLRVIKEAVSQNPSSVGKIIREVCKLPQKEADAFAALIEDIPLANLVHASRMVTDRLDFLQFFNSVVHLNPFATMIRERTQLHRIIENNTWLFDEEYAIGTSDKPIRAILEKHIHILGRDHLAPEFQDGDIKQLIAAAGEAKAKTSESWSRIPDLLLWQEFHERRAEEYEFLVIELKRPGVLIGRKEIQQIEDYALAVTNSPFTDRERSRWVFMVISDDLDDNAMRMAHDAHRPAFTVSAPTQERYEIRALPWSRIIRTAAARHDHLRKWLDHNPTLERAMAKSGEVYSEFLPEPKPVASKGKVRQKNSKAKKH